MLGAEEDKFRFDYADGPASRARTMAHRMDLKKLATNVLPWIDVSRSRRDLSISLMGRGRYRLSS